MFFLDIILAFLGHSFAFDPCSYTWYLPSMILVMYDRILLGIQLLRCYTTSQSYIRKIHRITRQEPAMYRQVTGYICQEDTGIIRIKVQVMETVRFTAPRAASPPK